MGFFSNVTDTVGDFFEEAKDFAFGTEPEIKTGKVQKWTPWQQELGRKLGRELKGGPESREYTGQLPGTAGLSDLQQLSLTGLERALGGEGVLKEQEEFISSVLDPERRQKQMQEYFEQTVQEPMMESFREDIIPGIRQQYAPSGYWSGHRVKAEEEAMEDLIDSLTRERTRMSYEAEQSALDRALQAAGMGSPTARGFERGLRLGGIPRGVTREGREAEYEEWLRQRDEEDEWLREVMGALGLSGIEPYAIGQPGTTGAVQDFIGEFAGSLGGGAAGSMF
jgi:hypothetical protein